MRLVLALLAVMALLVSPVTATAAQAACGHDRAMAMTGTMANMDGSAMPALDHAKVQKATADPCCDHAKHGRMSDKSCAQACAASCVAAATLLTPLASVDLAFTRARPSLARLASVEGHEPAGLERPPKSIA
jgi:uncharacterized protein involved in copper resistance